MVQDAGRVFDTGEKEKWGVGGKKGYIYSSSCEFLVWLVRYDNFDSYPVFWWLMNTNWPSLRLAQSPGTPWMRCLDTRFSTCGEESSWHWALLLDHTPLLPLRPHATQSKQSSFQVAATVQPSNPAINMPSGGKRTANWCHKIANTSLFSLRCF